MRSATRGTGWRVGDAMKQKRQDKTERTANAHVVRRSGKDDIHEQREPNQGEEGTVSTCAVDHATERKLAGGSNEKPHGSR